MTRYLRVTSKSRFWNVGLVTVLFAVVGVVLLLQIHAATASVSLEPETGLLGGTAKIIRDSTASAGTAIAFGANVSSSGFVHPGIQYTKQQLDTIKAQILAGSNPWAAAEKATIANRYAATSWVPKPVSAVECGNGSSTLNVGCDAQRDDSTAAYTQAVLWYMTGNKAYADSAVRILNAWSGTLTSMPWDGTSTYGNNKLQAGWSGSNFVRAAEILRYSNAGWSSTDISRFQTMLTKVYQPLVISSWSGGGFNWVMLFADVTMDIGVFNDDKPTFDAGVAAWRGQVPAHIYLLTDGSQPKTPPAPVKISAISTYWKTNTFLNGQTQETCRDLGHTAMGLASIVYAAETARIQGIDLYGEQATRIKAALELQSTGVGDLRNGTSIPANLCGGNLTMGGGAALQTGQVGYDEFVGRLGQSMPATQQFLDWYSPIPNNVGNLHMQWESLTTAP